MQRPTPVRKVSAYGCFLALIFFNGWATELRFATRILSLLLVVMPFAFYNKFVRESNLLFRKENPKSSVDALLSVYIVANFDMRSFCIIMIFPLIFVFELRFCISIKKFRIL